MRSQVSSIMRRISLLVAAIGLVVGLAPVQVFAVTTNISPEAKVSFTFDDGFASAYTQAAPTLAKYGLVGTGYVVSGCVGMTTVPNTCHADTGRSYMTWAQVVGLQNTYGWEIGSHTATHPYLASSDAGDGQPNVLTPAQVQQELTQSKADLTAHGLNVMSFASPYGDYNNPVHAQIAKYYATHRGFADVGRNAWPYSDTLLYNFPVQSGVTVSQVKAQIDAAIAEKSWLVLSLHEIKTNPSPDPDEYEYGTGQLDQIAAYVKQKQDAGLIKSVKVKDGPVASDTNLLSNSSFNGGLGGWTTDSPTTITADSGNNGSYPDPTNSVRLTSASANKHLFSPKTAVDPATTYMFKTFVNLANITQSEFAYYIDEYDANGNWISGQYKPVGATQAFVENINFTYKPSTQNVRQASLQVIAPGSAGLNAYFDNPQMFPLTATQQQPTNLVPNGTFDAGLSGGWTTDSATTIKADTANHGSPSNPVNSISLAAATTNKHLFSPKVAVNSTKTYSLSSYLNITALTSNEVGFYIDEYNASGGWVSGQYRAGYRTLGVNNVSFNYTPTSTNVATASLQLIVPGNSALRAYYDDVKWYAN
jgi:peptidoglycan/xylan/chitin deacetylase (PgdA/CDA1 family)